MTAFIIESYKTLSPEPSTMTVVLVYHISLQLSTITNTTELNISLPDLKSSPTSAIITNVFWFLSLALSLTCALTATLVEQWASDYIRAIERRESAAIKAQIRAYLFEGIENSNVAAIVEGSPLLLHASLLSFFIGLIFFLHPISNIVAFLSAGILGVFCIVYLSATIAPLINIASPIKTPLTTLALQFSFARHFLRKISLCGIKMTSFILSQVGAGAQTCRQHVKKFSAVVVETLTKFLSVLARLNFPLRWLQPFTEIWADNVLCTSELDTIKESTALNDSLPEFYDREIKSVSWTLQHTTNDRELLVFLEGIPVYLNSHWSDLHFGKPSPSRRNSGNSSPDHVLRTVLQHPESTFLLKLKTFIATRMESMNERDASAVVETLSCLFENKIHLYSVVTTFFLDYPWLWEKEMQSFLDRAIALHPSLSPAIQRLHVLAMFHCAQARGSKYKTNLSTDSQCWPVCDVLYTVEPLRYSELRPFWEAIWAVLGVNCRFPSSGWEIFTVDSAATAVETNQAITLLSLCTFFWKSVQNPQGHFTNSNSFDFLTEDLIKFVSPLAEGSAGAQQGFSAAMLLITSALEDVSPELKRRGLYGAAVGVVSRFMYPLVKITDKTAITTAQRVLCSRLCGEECVLLGLPSSWFGNPAFNQIYCAKSLCLCLSDSPYWCPIPKNVTTFTGMRSDMQIKLTHYLSMMRWLHWMTPQDIARFFSLLGTLDEPVAVRQCQKALNEFLKTQQAISSMDATRDALAQLNFTASDNGFIYKELCIRDSPGAQEI